MQSFVTGLALVICFLLLPGSFVGAYFLVKRWTKDTAGRVILTIVLGVIFFVGGVTGTVAGCASLVPFNMH
jgi:hypothetical protein